MSEHPPIGHRFGRLVVTGDAGRNMRHNRLLTCTCDCGNIIISRETDLKRGDRLSCGCYRRELSRELVKHAHAGATKHGASRDPLYRIWRGMVSRCENPRDINYQRYGARGVRVCDEWHDVNKFIEWATSHGYMRGLSIERIDNDSGYCPENCVWATAHTQSNNRRNSRRVWIGNVLMPVSTAADSLDVSVNTMKSRIRAGKYRTSRVYEARL